MSQLSGQGGAENDIDGYCVRGAAEALHLPSHSPGQVGLFHDDSGTLFGADAVYDGLLIYKDEGMNITDCSEPLRRLRKLPVTQVHGRHDPAFGRDRLHEMIDHYLALWEMSDGC